MALSESAKTSLAFKKLINMDYSYSGRAWYEENAGGGLNLHAAYIWADTIATAAPASSTSTMRAYNDSAGVGALKLTQDAGVPNERGWYAFTATNSARLTGWIPPKYAQGYTVELYEDDGTGTAKGNQIFTTDAMDWFFDYETGYLAIQDTHSFITPFWIQGYYYIGKVLSSSGIQTAHIQDSAITTAKINDGAVTASKLNVNLDDITDVDTTGVADGNVLTYTSGGTWKVGTGGTGLSDCAVITAYINDDAVTPAKIDATGEFTMKTLIVSTAGSTATAGAWRIRPDGNKLYFEILSAAWTAKFVL